MIVVANRQRPLPSGRRPLHYADQLLKGWQSPEFRQEGGPSFWFEAQHRPFCRLAVADTDAAACEAGSLETLPIAHAVRALPPVPAEIKFILIVPYWGPIAHLSPFGPVAKESVKLRNNQITTS
jgi:hypothetical protein